MIQTARIWNLVKKPPKIEIVPKRQREQPHPQVWRLQTATTVREMLVRCVETWNLANARGAQAMEQSWIGRSLSRKTKKGNTTSMRCRRRQFQLHFGGRAAMKISTKICGRQHTTTPSQKYGHGS